MKSVNIYTDGSSLGNPGAGGWAAILRLNDSEHSKEIGGGFAYTTNNRMELMAVIKALEALKMPCQVNLYTDSRYVCDAINKGWLNGWQKTSWNSGKVKNIDLWQALLPLLKTHSISMHWLRGHNGHPENERCDLLAKQYASQKDLPADTGYLN